MSSYIQFYVKNGDARLPIGTFTRSNVVYKTFYDESIVVYGKYAPLKVSDILDAVGYIKDTIKRYERIIESNTETIKIIAGANNDIDEKVEKIYEINGEIGETREEIEELNAALGYVSALLEIVDEASYRSGFDKDSYVWCGIDAVWDDEEDDE